MTAQQHRSGCVICWRTGELEWAWRNVCTLDIWGPLREWEPAGFTGKDSRSNGGGLRSDHTGMGHLWLCEIRLAVYLQRMGMNSIPLLTRSTFSNIHSYHRTLELLYDGRIAQPDQRMSTWSTPRSPLVTHLQAIQASSWLMQAPACD